MRKPAAPVKPLALMASARLGGVSSVLKVGVYSFLKNFIRRMVGTARSRAFTHPTISVRRVGSAACPPSGRNAYRQRLDAAHKAGIDPLRLADDFDAVEPLQHFLPHDLQLQFGQPHADAAMNAEAERQMG